MGRKKKSIQYTLKDSPGILIEVESSEDNEAARQKALDELMTRVEADELSLDNFPNGLSADDLIFVDSPTKAKAVKSDEELQPMEKAAKEVAQFALMKVALQKNQEAAQQFLDLITALFTPEPLTQSQIETAQDKSFAKTLENLAAAKIEFDGFKKQAEAAWELLKPAVVTTSSETVRTPDSTTSKGKRHADEVAVNNEINGDVDYTPAASTSSKKR